MNTLWHKRIWLEVTEDFEVLVKVYNHPKHGKLFGTVVSSHGDHTLVSVIGQEGPLDFDIYPGGDYFYVDGFVSGIYEDNFVKRGI